CMCIFPTCVCVCVFVLPANQSARVHTPTNADNLSQLHSTGGGCLSVCLPKRPIISSAPDCKFSRSLALSLSLRGFVRVRGCQKPTSITANWITTTTATRNHEQAHQPIAVLIDTLV